MYARDYGNTPGTVKAFEEAYAREAMQNSTHPTEAPHEKPPEKNDPCGSDAETELLLLLLLLFFG